MGPNSRKHVVMVRSIKQKYERTSENYVNKHLSFFLVLHPDKKPDGTIIQVRSPLY